MANQAYPIKHQDQFNLSKVTLYIADTDAGKPDSGLVAGDLCWAVDTNKLYLAISSATWVTVARLDDSNFWISGQIFNTNILFRTSESDTISGILDGRTQLTASRSWALPNVPGNGLIVGSGSNPPAIEDMGRVNATAKTAAIASTNLTNTTPAGTYRIAYYLRCTTADVTAGTIQFNATYTDSVGATTDSSAVVALTSTANRAQGAIVADLASGNITYSTTLTGIAGTSQYKLRVRCEFLG